MEEAIVLEVYRGQIKVGRLNLRLFLLVASLCLLVPVAAHAQTRQNTPRAVQQELAPADAFKQARSAMQGNDGVRLAQVRNAARQHPLAMYVDYWTLRIPLVQSARSQQRDVELEDRAANFMLQHPSTVYTDLLRRDLMLVAGRFGDWPKLEALNQNWVLQDDKSALCYAQLLKLKKTSRLEPDSQEAVLLSANFSEGCNALTETLIQTGAVPVNEFLPRAATAVFAGSVSAARSIANASPTWADKISDSHWARPALGVTSAVVRADKDVLALLYLRWAGMDVDATAQNLRTETGLNPNGRALVWAQVAALSARKTQSVAHEYAAELAKAISAAGPKGVKALPDEVGAWALRAALRGRDWKSVQTIEAAFGTELRKDATWIYWRGKAQRELGAPKEQWEKTFGLISAQYGFYGQLAAEELGQLTSLNVPSAETAKLDATTQAVVSGPSVKRALQFYELGLRFEGNREWNWAIRGLTDPQLNAVARWADQQKLFDRAISTAERTTVQHDYAMRFVTPFSQPLTASAKNHGLDPALVFGLIRQESRFLAEVKSSVGATGLMQLMPGTARWVAKKMGVANFELEQMSQVEPNLEFGSFYFRTVLDNLDGNAAMAAAAYNAGPGRPRQWRSTFPGKVEGAIFAETIPFHETRDYVKKVLSNAAYYGVLLTGQPQSLKARLGEVVPKTAAVVSDIP